MSIFWVSAIFLFSILCNKILHFEIIAILLSESNKFKLFVSCFHRANSNVFHYTSSVAIVGFPW